MAGDPLDNPKHELFAQEIAKGQTQAEAYEKAGYKPSESNASTLRSNQKVSDRVAELLASSAERAEITIANVMKELSRVGFSDVRRLFDESGNLLSITDLEDDVAGFVSSIEVVANKKGDETEHVHKIKTWDKLSALDKLGKQLGMFKDQLEVTGKDGAPLIENVSDEELSRRMAFLLAKGK